MQRSFSHFNTSLPSSRLIPLCCPAYEDSVRESLAQTQQLILLRRDRKTGFIEY